MTVFRGNRVEHLQIYIEGGVGSIYPDSIDFIFHSFGRNLRPNTGYMFLRH
jgi:hypothetical protein